MAHGAAPQDKGRTVPSWFKRVQQGPPMGPMRRDGKRESPIWGDICRNFDHFTGSAHAQGKMGSLGVPRSICPSQLQSLAEYFLFLFLDQYIQMSVGTAQPHLLPLSVLTRNDCFPAGELLPLPVCCREKTAWLT